MAQEHCEDIFVASLSRTYVTAHWEALSYIGKDSESGPGNHGTFRAKPGLEETEDMGPMAPRTSYAHGSTRLGGQCVTVDSG